jgi:hypothetical protein
MRFWPPRLQNSHLFYYVDVVNVNEFENPAVKQKWEDHAVNSNTSFPWGAGIAQSV